MGIVNTTLAGASGNQGYFIQRSLRLRSSASAYLSRTPASAGNRQTWTWSGWVKRGTLGGTIGLFGASTSSTATDFVFFGGDALYFQSTVGAVQVGTTQVFRDPSAWYAIIISVDTTQATASNRIKIYVNGSQVTAFSATTYPAQNSSLNINNNISTKIGSVLSDSNFTYYFDGYLAEVNFIDGQALTPSSFGQTDAVTGVWTPKKYTGTYGTNGFYLPFSDNTSATTLAYDKSGNGNNWTPNNISTTAGGTYDSMTDVPTLTSATAGNYCTLNPLNYASGGITLSGANLNYTAAAISSNYPCGSTMGVSSGKWYFEVTITTVGGSYPFISILPVANYFLGSTTSVAGYSYSCWAGNGGFSNGDVCGIAFDLDSLTFSAYKNGVLMSGPYVTTGSITSGLTWMPAISGVNGCVMNANFGQRPFSYTPPTGFKALNTFNLPDPTIKKPNQYMDATLWTGDGTASRLITNSGSMQPDLVWFKSRNNAINHRLFDSVRGNDNVLISSSANAEAAWIGDYQGPTTNGFTVGTGQGLNLNTSGYTMVGWQWKKGATPGFDIVTYTGNGVNNRTVSHSLGVAPAMIIVKDRTSAYNWDIYHQSLGISATLTFTSNATRNLNAFGTNAPTSSVFYTQDSFTNTNGDAYVAYLFAEIVGFSKFGSYTGNGSTDGPFVYCGFRPKYVLMKAIDATNANDWVVIDSVRKTFNEDGVGLQPNLSNAEFDDSGLGTNAISIDIVSNGFKLRGTSTRINGSNSTNIFAAFAENPFKYSLAR